MYGPDYPTCSRTFATFRILSNDLAPGEITAALGLEPSLQYAKGERRTLRRRDAAEKRHGWFLSSEGQVESLDNRDHLEWLFERLVPLQQQLAELLNRGAEADIFCFWHSKDGHGGPALSPEQAAKLVQLGLEISYDIYARSSKRDE